MVHLIGKDASIKKNNKLWKYFLLSLYVCQLYCFFFCIIANPNKSIAFVFTFACTLFIFSAIGLIISSSEPSAMDVYRGKTTLEITYKEGVAIDSIVVFK